MNETCDLHCHSTCSDGQSTPKELVAEAKRLDVSALILTDHDTLAGWSEFSKEADRLGIDTIPGVEISCEFDQTPLHLLAYGFSTEDPSLNNLLAEIRRDRSRRFDEILMRLRGLGLPVESPNNLINPGRRHVSELLVQQGYCSTHQEAFDRYLRDSGPADVAKRVPSLEEAISAVHQAGGVTSLAHPAGRPVQRLGGLNRLISELVASGLDGIEVYHPSHRPTSRRRASALAQRFDLISTGGSDFHGTPGADPSLGALRLPYDLFVSVKESLDDPITDSAEFG